METVLQKTKTVEQVFMLAHTTFILPLSQHHVRAHPTRGVVEHLSTIASSTVLENTLYQAA